MLPTPYEETMIQTNGVKLHVVAAGPKNGTPVILLHGFPEFWFGWRHQIPALAAAGYRVIAPDQRGYNLSDKPEGVRAYRIEELGKDIIGLADHFGYEKVLLAGHDWGAAVAWGMAVSFPQRIQRLAILNVPHPAVMLDFIKKSPKQMLKSWYIGLFQIPGLADWLFTANDFAFGGKMLRGSGQPNTFNEDDLREYKRAWSQPGALTAMINWYRAVFRYRPAAAPDIRVHVPTLILWGKQDVALSFEMAQQSVALCDHGRLVFFENATHWVQHDEADSVNQYLLDFFRAGEN